MKHQKRLWKNCFIACCFLSLLCQVTCYSLENEQKGKCDSKAGEICVDLNDCLLMTPMDKFAEYEELSTKYPNCSHGRVCCPVLTECVYEHPQHPVTKCCGRIPSTESSNLPWMGLIEYVYRNERTILSTAVLISGKYALTDTGVANIYNRAKSIDIKLYLHLGPFNSSSLHRGCILDDGSTCDDGPISALVERVHVHEDYQPVQLDMKSRIAIVELKRLVPYTDNVYPICLPSSNFDINYNKMTVANYNGGFECDAVKSDPVFNYQHVQYQTRKSCKRHYSESKVELILDEREMCASAHDSALSNYKGAPMMHNRGYMEIVGILVAKDPEGQAPSIFAKVNMNWIISVTNSHELWPFQFLP